MYHTTCDIVTGTRAVGIDAGFIDSQDPTPKSDGNFAAEALAWADTADLYMLHLGIPEPYFSDGTPLIVCMHGHPLYSMQIELYGTEPGNEAPFSTLLAYFSRKAPTWFVSFWEREQSGYWTPLDDTRKHPRVRYIPRGIDIEGSGLGADGPTVDLSGKPAIVIADQFRLFKDAIPSIWGAYNYWRDNPEARVHLYAMPPEGTKSREVLNRWLLDTGIHRCIGSVNGVTQHLPEVLRSADVLLSTVTGESRVLVEAQACGCPVVAPCPEADVQCDAFWLPQKVAAALGRAIDSGSPQARAARAERTKAAYRIERTAIALQRLYKEILG
jgi:glycosyltransferase involved in cell wall biosynthesis